MPTKRKTIDTDKIFTDTANRIMRSRRERKIAKRINEKTAEAGTKTSECPLVVAIVKESTQ